MAKLVRDNIPNIIQQQGKKAVTRCASNIEYWNLLFLKLLEEVVEFSQNPNAEELADVTEVVFALGEFWGISETSIQKARLKKRNEKGAFSRKLILEEVLEAS